MKRLPFLLLALALMSSALAALAQPYALDPKFGTGGYALSAAPGNDRGYDLIAQPDGKVATFGFSGASGQIARLNADGSPDATFATAGAATFKVNSQNTVCYAGALQPDGKIVAACALADNTLAVVRLLPNGQFDPAFDADGIALLPVPAFMGGEETPLGLALQPNGAIVVSFLSQPAGSQGMVTTVARLLSTGSPDPSFSGDGVATLDVAPASNTEVVSGAQVAGGLIYVGGYARLNDTTRFTLCCFKPDGTPNLAFGTGGIAIGTAGVCSDIRVQASGRIVAAGYTATGPRQILVTRFLPNGATDVSFGNSGIFTAEYSPIKINGMALTSNGGILLAGYQSSFRPYSFFITALTDDGFPAAGFVGGLFFQEKINGIDEELHNIAVDQQGRIVAVGYYENNATGENLAVLRLAGPGPEVRLIVGQASGAQGDTVLVPVRLEGCDVLYAAQGMVGLSNPTVGKIISFQKKAADVSFNGDLFSFFTANGTSLTASDTLFFVKILLTGNPGDSTSVTIAAPPGSVIEVACGLTTLTPHTVVAGQAKVLSSFSVSGILLDRLGAPVGQAIVTLEGKDKTGADFLLSEVADASGTYTFNNVPHGSTFTVKVLKDINPKNGITSYDLLVGQRWLLGMKPPEFNSPLQVLAGNANNNHLFSTLDLGIAQAVFLGNLAAFPNNNSWVFVRASHVFAAPFTVSNPFPYPSDSTIVGLKNNAVVHFTGIKVGDIVTSADPQNRPAGEGSGEAPALRLVAEQSRAGQDIALIIKAEQFEQIGSAQWGLQFDPSVMTYLGADAPGWAVGDKAAADGLLRLSWFSPDGQPKTLASGTVLVALRFRAVAPSLSLAEPLVARSEAALEAEAVAVLEDGTFESRDLALRFQANLSAAHGPMTEAGYSLGQSAPNPTTGLVQIPFALGEPGQAVLNVFDNLGRVVRRSAGFFEQGRQQVELDLSGLAPGLYRYQLTSGRFSATQNLVVSQ